MSRYDIAGGDEAQYEPGSERRVLRNKLGIVDPEQMNQVESELLAQAMVDSYDWAYLGMRFTSEIICEMHRQWLGDVYDFAGELRQVDISNGGLLFCPWVNIATELRRLDADVLARFPITSNPTKDQPGVGELAEFVALAHAELLLIHPFREGNGRLARWLADLMVLLSGYRAPRYKVDTDALRARYFAAMRRAYLYDTEDLTALFVDWIERAQES